MDSPQFQMEFYIPGKCKHSGTWIPQHALAVGDYSRHAWRKVLVGHTHKDKMSHSIATVRSCGYAAMQRAQCERYCQWARLKGLTSVSTYRDDWLSNHFAMVFALATNEIDAAEIIGPAPTAEVCDE